MKSTLKQWKVIAGIATIAVVAVVLALTIPSADNGVPDNDEAPAAKVAATVNGEEIIQADVAEVQQLYAAQGMPISEAQALEQLIQERVLYQAAELGDFVPTEEDAEEQMEAQVAMMGMTMEEFHQALEAEGLCYDEQLEDFRRRLAIQNYLSEAIGTPEVTEEEAREFYEDYEQQYPEDELPPFEEIKAQIITHLEQEKQQAAVLLVIEELVEEADVEYM